MATMICVACDRRSAPSAALPAMCSRCYLALPQITRELYAHGGLALPRLVGIAKERVASVRTLRRENA